MRKHRRSYVWQWIDRSTTKLACITLPRGSHMHNCGILILVVGLQADLQDQIAAVKVKLEQMKSLASTSA